MIEDEFSSQVFAMFLGILHLEWLYLQPFDLRGAILSSAHYVNKHPCLS